MRKLSFKLKITLWYTIVMSVLVVGLLVFLLSTTRYYTTASMQDKLREMVAASVGTIETEDGMLELDDDFQAYENGMYLSFYDSSQTKLFGTVPSVLKDLEKFQDDTMQEIVIDNVKWYVYDLYLKSSDVDGIWLRGIASQAEVSSAYHNAIMMLVLVFPIFILLVALLGYVFTNRALRPVRHITETAQMISTGNDLSIRIPATNKKDELQQLANVFNQMLDRLFQAFQHEKQFTQDASHELRTPTTVIISQAEYAIEQAKTLDEAKESLTVILGQARKMAGLTNQLLTLSRIETGQEVLELEETDLSILTEMVVDELRGAASQKQILLQTEITEDIILLVDETLMMRLWVNLISNAIQYGRVNGLVKISLSQDEEWVTGSVWDNGIGIAKEHQERIWERFYQVDKARNHTKSGSMGLGLSMVRWIVEAHQGTIEVESEPGHGTTFTFYLPK